MGLNLAYRIKRFFRGENGIVERVESQNSLDKNNDPKDDDGNLPKRIFFKNPLGDLIETTSSLVLESRDSFKGRGYIDYRIYKQYQIGDKFP